MKFISNLSTHVIVIIIKSQEKIKSVKRRFWNFNLNGQNFAECKNQNLCKLPAVCLIYIALRSAHAHLDNIMQIDCLAYKYFVFYRLSLDGYNIWYCIVCDYRDTPNPKIS